MATGRRFAGKRLALTAAFAVLLVAAFGVGCKGFFVDPTLTSLTINPTAPSVQYQQTTTLSAYAVDSNNHGSYLKSGVSWSTSDPQVAAITGACENGNPCGNATISGVTPGQSTITASAQNVTNTATLTVYLNVSTMAISPTSQTVSKINGTTPEPYIVTVNGSTDISNVATLTAYLNGTAVTAISCTYSTTNSAGNGIYCTGDGTETAGTKYTLIASYTGTTITATAYITFNAS
jgi:trimeric autotransporter adhesin